MSVSGGLRKSITCKTNYTRFKCLMTIGLPALYDILYLAVCDKTKHTIHTTSALYNLTSALYTEMTLITRIINKIIIMYVVCSICVQS